MSQASGNEVKVGASVMTSNGNMYQGSNLEMSGSSYGMSITAEDCALFKAYSEGQREIKAIAVHVKHLVKEENHSALVTPAGQPPLSVSNLQQNTP
jgi:cytidine deaminase